MLAVFVGSDLEIPNPLPKLLSLYLLLSIGFKGGVELNKSGLNSYIVMCLAAGIFMALLVPLYSFSFYDASLMCRTPLLSPPPTAQLAP
jgi:hypothetical protein